MAGINGALAPELKTVFLPASPAVRHITATLVRQIAVMGGDVSPFVPAVGGPAHGRGGCRTAELDHRARSTRSSTRVPHPGRHRPRSVCRSRRCRAAAQALDPENTLYMDIPAGRVVIQLRPDLAPNHVERVKKLTRQGFYDGTPSTA